jgi:hypothetical protein
MRTEGANTTSMNCEKYQSPARNSGKTTQPSDHFFDLVFNRSGGDCLTFWMYEKSDALAELGVRCIER